MTLEDLDYKEKEASWACPVFLDLEVSKDQRVNEVSLENVVQRVSDLKDLQDHPEYLVKHTLSYFKETR